MKHFVTLDTLDDIVFDLVPGDRIFLRGDLGAGKTTFAQKLIQKHLQQSDLVVTSPTYTYYQKYGDKLYHFDLYRVNDLADLTRIGADEILDDPESICIIEWAERLGDTTAPTKTIDIQIAENGRTFLIHNCQVSKIDNI